MTILEKYQISWFNELSFKQFIEVIEQHKKYKDFNKLGILFALNESKKLTVEEVISIRDLFKEKFFKYYQHRAFTHSRLILSLEQLDCETEEDFKKIEYFFEEAFQKAISKTKKGKKIHTINRNKTALNDAYSYRFSDPKDVFIKLNANLITKKYSFHKTNFNKYLNGRESLPNSFNSKPKVLGGKPTDVKKNKRIKKRQEGLKASKQMQDEIMMYNESKNSKIQFVKRKDIVSNHQIIGDYLAKFQDLFFSDEDVALFEKAGKKEEYLAMYDLMDIPKLEIVSFNKIIGLKQKGSIDVFTKELSQKLFELLSELEVKELIILIPIKLDFLEGNKNNYPPIKKASQSLKELIGSKSYSEALQIELKELETMVEIFFWLTHGGRFDALMFFDREERFVFDICKHGNIHWTEFEKESLKDCDSFSKDWIEIARCEEDNFIEK